VYNAANWAAKLIATHRATRGAKLWLFIASLPPSESYFRT
jgi:hypothetical protein